LTHSLWARLIIPVVLFTLLSPTAAVKAQQPHEQTSASSGSDLTAAQQSQIAARKARFEKDIAALRADAKLTPAQKQAKFLILAQATDTDLLAILTPAQRVQVLKRKAINVEFEKNLAALRADTTMTEAQKETKYQAMMLARQNALLDTLPPAQRKIVVKEHQEKMARIDALRRQIQQIGDSIQKSQTPAQLKQIQAISQSTQKQEAAVYADTKLTTAEKESRITALRQQAQAKINALLTPAQRAKFARLRELVASASRQ
jgi:hypothetical protein